MEQPNEPAELGVPTANAVDDVVPVANKKSDGDDNSEEHHVVENPDHETAEAGEEEEEADAAAAAQSAALMQAQGNMSNTQIQDLLVKIRAQRDRQQMELANLTRTEQMLMQQQTGVAAAAAVVTASALQQPQAGVTATATTPAGTSQSQLAALAQQAQALPFPNLLLPGQAPFPFYFGAPYMKPRPQADRKLKDFDPTKVVQNNELDVLFGRGLGSSHHYGNKAFILVTRLYKGQYSALSRGTKGLMAQHFHRCWKEMGGRFLKPIDPDDNKSQCIEVSLREALDKIMMALRQKIRAGTKSKGYFDNSNPRVNEIVSNVLQILKPYLPLEKTSSEFVEHLHTLKPVYTDEEMGIDTGNRKPNVLKLEDIDAVTGAAMDVPITNKEDDDNDSDVVEKSKKRSSSTTTDDGGPRKKIRRATTKYRSSGRNKNMDNDDNRSVSPERFGEKEAKNGEEDKEVKRGTDVEDPNPKEVPLQKSEEV